MNILTCYRIAFERQRSAYLLFEYRERSYVTTPHSPHVGAGARIEFEMNLRIGCKSQIDAGIVVCIQGGN